MSLKMACIYSDIFTHFTIGPKSGLAPTSIASFSSPLSVVSLFQSFFNYIKNSVRSKDIIENENGRTSKNDLEIDTTDNNDETDYTEAFANISLNRPSPC